MGGQTVSASYAKAFIDFAANVDADAASLRDRSQITASDLADPDNRIPLEQYKTIMRVAKEMTGEPALALKFGESALFFERSILGLIIRVSNTMGEAFAQMNRYGPLVNDLNYTGAEGRFVVVRDRAGIWLEDRRTDPNEFPEITESAIARLVSDYAHCFPERPPFVKAIRMTHPEPSYRSDYDRVLKAPLEFDSDRNALLIDESWLYAEVPTANRYVFGIFSAHAADLLMSLEESRTIRGKVECLLIPMLHSGDVGMDDIASALGLSRPTLYRKLKEEGVSYEKVLDELRCRMAIEYLNARKASINEIAYLVGFSDPTAFSRAFRRWTGKSPSEVRAAPQLRLA